MHAAPTFLRALCGLLLGLAACDSEPDETADPMNVCVYETASCYDETCPPDESDYTVQCIDTTLDTCTISEETVEEYNSEIDTTFYLYTRNVQWMGGITCADVT